MAEVNLSTSGAIAIVVAGTPAWLEKHLVKNMLVLVVTKQKGTDTFGAR